MKMNCVLPVVLIAISILISASFGDIADKTKQIFKDYMKTLHTLDKLGRLPKSQSVNSSEINTGPTVSDVRKTEFLLI